MYEHHNLLPWYPIFCCHCHYNWGRSTLHKDIKKNYAVDVDSTLISSFVIDNDHLVPLLGGGACVMPPVNPLLQRKKHEVAKIGILKANSLIFYSNLMFSFLQFSLWSFLRLVYEDQSGHRGTLVFEFCHFPWHIQGTENISVGNVIILH